MRDGCLYDDVNKNASYGFYELKQKFRKEMQDFYRDEYYQENHATYSIKEYDQIDIENKNNLYAAKQYVLEKWGGYTSSTHSILDIGAGEGYALSYFDKMGWRVAGIDFSSYGMEAHNPEMVKYLQQGDFYKVINDYATQGITFDFINADNLLEHLPKPEGFFHELKKVSHKGTIICVMVPNDFSRIQQLAYSNGKIDRAFWVTKDTSEHFNYFSVDTLCSLGKQAGFEKIIALGDWPIDFFLLHEETNYTRKKSVGHDCHIACTALENSLYAESMEKTIDLFKALAEIGLGREISVFFKY